MLYMVCMDPQLLRRFEIYQAVVEKERLMSMEIILAKYVVVDFLIGLAHFYGMRVISFIKKMIQTTVYGVAIDYLVEMLLVDAVCIAQQKKLIVFS